MKATKEADERIAKMTFSSVYPHYVSKVEKKGKTKAQLHELITWLTGYDDKAIAASIKAEETFQQFFDKATLHPHASLITGVICGYRVEEIDYELTRKTRYLDKIIDELARGKKMESIMRKPKG